MCGVVVVVGRTSGRITLAVDQFDLAIYIVDNVYLVTANANVHLNHRAASLPHTAFDN